MSIKYHCSDCESGCTIEVPDEKYEPMDCPSFSGSPWWKKVEDAPQNTIEEKQASA